MKRIDNKIFFQKRKRADRMSAREGREIYHRRSGVPTTSFDKRKKNRIAELDEQAMELDEDA